MHINFFTTTVSQQSGYLTVLQSLIHADFITSKTIFNSDSFKNINFHKSSLKSRILSLMPIVALYDLLIFMVNQPIKNKGKSMNIAISEHYAVLLYFIKIIFGIEYVIFVHGTYVYLPKEKFLFKKSFKHAKYLIFVSDYTYDQYRSFTRDLSNCRVVTLGIDKNKFYEDMNIVKRDEIIFVGNQKARKGLNILLKALRSIEENKLSQKIKLVIVGHINENTRNEIENEFPYKITYHEEVTESELKVLYQRAKLNVLISQHVGKEFEGFGLVHLEAIACGTWTVGSTRSGNPNAIHPKNGDLIAPHNYQTLGSIILNIFGSCQYRKPKAHIKSVFEYQKEISKLLVGQF